MDWDDDIYDRDEIREHLDALGVLQNFTLEDLLTRTTKKTRSGNEFGFKPTNLSIGTVKDGQFYAGFSSTIEKSGISIHTEDSIPSSFWIRFREQWFQMRAFCSGYDGNLSFTPYECRIPFRDVVSGGIQLRSSYDGDRVTATLTIMSRRPPKYNHYLRKVLRIGKEAVYDRHATAADFRIPPTNEVSAGWIYAVGDALLEVDPGLWLAHRITMSITPRQYKLLWMCMVRLRLLDLHPDFSTPTSPDTVMTMPDWATIESLLYDMRFDKRYLVEAVISHGIVVVPEVPDLLKSLTRYRHDDQIRVLEGLFKWTRHGPIGVDIRHVARCALARKVFSAPQHLVPTRRCLVTPTRCILNPPALETSNEMLRDFGPHADRFLRVQFVDDDGDFPVTGETLLIDDAVYGVEGVFARVRRALFEGIYVAGRHYIFATFGESQAKERGCWMIAEDGEFNVSAILASMGDLSQERIIAKHAARQSLRLSTTRALPYSLKVSSIDDVVRNSYTFTDGVGHCSKFLAQEMAALLGYKVAPVSAAQIRIGGAKGVLSIVQDETLEKDEIRLRLSMVKIRGDFSMRSLNVIKVATFSKATLNRQAIVLLEDRSVSAKILLDLFLQEKRNIEGLDTGFDPARLASITTFPLSKALECKVKDPLVENVTRVLKCRLLSDLKWKAWVEVQESAYLMGVADETDSLEEGQIFCQIQPPGEDSRVIQAPCTIYRNPCLHPGDVRRVTAVDCPKLRHLRNVIVFNTRGRRDLPNMLGGGDLDGDFYSLLWDKRLLIHKDRVHEPMDYTPPEPVRSYGPVTLEQTKEHFVELMKNDVLGRVCNAHLALADQLSPSDEQCLTLARLASQAVDFTKTGVAVHQFEIPRVDEYPDFMGKEYKFIRVFKKQPIKSYPSEKVLGRMFRAIDPEPVFEEAEEWPTESRILRINGHENGFRRYLEAAAVEKARYEFELTGLLRRYNITEIECVAGVLLRSPKTRLKVEKDHDIRVAVRDAYASLVASAVSRIEEHLVEHPVSDNIDACRRAWVIASYKLTHDSAYASYLKIDWSAFDEDFLPEDADDEDLDDLETSEPERRLSFPWLLHKTLFELLQ